MLTSFFTIWLIDTLSILSPGPSLVLIAQSAVSRGRAYALAIAAGLALASALWATLALAGAESIGRLAPEAGPVLRVAAGLYLLWLSVQLWRSSAAPGRMGDSGRPRASLAGGVSLGLATSLLNPKALAYFASVFIFAVPQEWPVAAKAGVAAAIMANALLWYGLAAWLLSTRRVARAGTALRRPMVLACSVLMAACGISLMI